MCKGWFAPCTASALRDHLRGQVLRLFVDQATDAAKALPSYAEAQTELATLDADETVIRSATPCQAACAPVLEDLCSSTPPLQPISGPDHQGCREMDS